METLYVVQGFYGMDHGLVAGKPILHGMEKLARTRGEALADECDGVLVYAQGADADRNEYSAPVILAMYGNVPQPEVQSLCQPFSESSQVRRTVLLPRSSRTRGVGNR